MKLSGTAALYRQLKELDMAVQVTKRQIALAENMENDGEAPAKKTKSRKPRTPKALTFDVPPGHKSNGLDSIASE